jgi:hypothetical protein
MIPVASKTTARNTNFCQFLLGLGWQQSAELQLQVLPIGCSLILSVSDMA